LNFPDESGGGQLGDREGALSFQAFLSASQQKKEHRKEEKEKDNISETVDSFGYGRQYLCRDQDDRNDSTRRRRRHQVSEAGCFLDVGGTKAQRARSKIFHMVQKFQNSFSVTTRLPKEAWKGLKGGGGVMPNLGVTNNDACDGCNDGGSDNGNAFREQGWCGIEEFSTSGELAHSGNTTAGDLSYLSHPHLASTVRDETFIGGEPEWYRWPVVETAYL
jgi:hypothetical protein